MNEDKLKLTIGAIALSDWKRTFNIKKINQNYINYEYFKKSMYGGRCEIFKRKGKDIDLYDFNSLYPKVMHEYKYPIGKYYNIDSEYECEFHISYIKNINIPDMYIPPVPYRDKDRGVIYPIGKIKDGVYNSIDLEVFKKYGVEYDFIGGFGWNDSEYIFKDYISIMYPLKLQAKIDGNKGVYETVKRLMNALSGKMGQNPNKKTFEKITNTKIFLDREAKALKTKSTVFDDIYEFETETKKPITNHILSFIYSYARGMLYDTFMQILNKGGNVYYCDTDSVFTNLELKNHDTELGKLALEHKDIQLAYFGLPKSYALKLSKKEQKELREKQVKKIDIVKFKGFDVESVLFDDLQKFVEDKEEISEKRISTSTLKRIMGGSMGAYECLEIKKTTQESSFLKREKVGKYDTKPIKMNEW